MQITLVCAMGKNREIGEKNKLLWNLPKDMQHFRKKTAHKVVIMGRKTFESIGKPLPNRKNIVLTRDTNQQFPPEVEIFDDLQKLLKSLESLKSLENQNESEICVIGGEQIYTLFLPYATHISLSVVQENFVHADAFFPKFSENDFEKISETILEKDEENIFSVLVQEWQRK